MPSLSCRCGNRINLSEIPNKNGYRLLAETLQEELIEAIVRLHMADSGPADFEWGVNGVLGRRMVGPQIYQCTSCGRLAVFRSPGDLTVRQWYKPEESAADSATLLSSLLVEGE